MSEKKAQTRSMKVFVKPGSRAEIICRKRSANSLELTPTGEPRIEAIARGFRKQKELNLVDNGGKIIPDLIFTNFYLGGANAWNSQDLTNIDSSLSKAMSDQRLNNVLLQYFRGAPGITSTFKPSSFLQGAPPGTISQSEVEALLLKLNGDGKLAGFDLGKTVVNLMLPRNTVLTIGDGSGGELQRRSTKVASGEVEEKASSLEGLGGFHGSITADGTSIYYAVGVFSEGNNGIVGFDQSWKNVVATFYHELVEARTDADVEGGQVAWVNNERPSEEIGDIPLTLAGPDLRKVMKEVPLSDGSGTVPIQLMWSNAVGGPEGPIAHPHK